MTFEAGKTCVGNPADAPAVWRMIGVKLWSYMISNMIMKMWLCLNDVATMVKPRQKAVTYCRTRESLLFYGESLGHQRRPRHISTTASDVAAIAAAAIAAAAIAAATLASATLASATLTSAALASAALASATLATAVLPATALTITPGPSSKRSPPLRAGAAARATAKHAIAIAIQRPLFMRSGLLCRRHDGAGVRAVPEWRQMRARHHRGDARDPTRLLPPDDSDGRCPPVPQPHRCGLSAAEHSVWLRWRNGCRRRALSPRSWWALLSELQCQHGGSRRPLLRCSGRCVQGVQRRGRIQRRCVGPGRGRGPCPRRSGVPTCRQGRAGASASSASSAAAPPEIVSRAWLGRAHGKDPHRAGPARGGV